ncbi:MAG: type II toxin-antitoxin system RelE/ParE family toxin [Gammaproteobacteria bacterium]
MTWTVFLRKDAEEDIEYARAHYEAARTGLGDQFIDAVAEAIRALESNPEWPRLYYREFRRMLLNRFPYKICYLIDNRRVVIFRVLHGRQDHPRWLVK